MLAPGSPADTHPSSLRPGEVTTDLLAVSATCAMNDGVPITQFVPYWKMVSICRSVFAGRPGITSAPRRLRSERGTQSADEPRVIDMHWKHRRGANPGRRGSGIEFGPSVDIELRPENGSGPAVVPEEK